MNDDTEDRPSCPRPGEHVTTYTVEERPSDVIVHAIAALRGVEPTELEPLYDRIDPEALDELLGLPVIGNDGIITVEFTAEGFQITVRSDGTIMLCDPEFRKSEGDTSS